VGEVKVLQFNSKDVPVSCKTGHQQFVGFVATALIPKSIQDGRHEIRDANFKVFMG